jgi:hypothetical protein
MQDNPLRLEPHLEGDFVQWKIINLPLSILFPSLSSLYNKYHSKKRKKERPPIVKYWGKTWRESEGRER